MRVRRTTPEQEAAEKDAAFLKLTGIERLRFMREVADCGRKPGVTYELKGSRVRKVKRP